MKRILLLCAVLLFIQPIAALRADSLFSPPSFASSAERLRSNSPRQRYAPPSWTPPPPTPPPEPSDSSSSSFVISPTSYGADPTGALDSTAAFHQAIANLTTQPLSSGVRYLSDRVIDLGGITLDLQGGQYLISSPLVFPPGYGNYRITRGTVRAASNFTATTYSQHLIHIGNATSADVFSNCGQCSWGQFVTVSDMAIDGGHRAGGLYISGIMGAVLTRLYVTAFVDSGVSIKGGHEVQLLQAWFGVELWRERDSDSDRVMVPPQSSVSAVALNGTAGVRVVGFDNDLIDVVVFGTPVGVYVQGACNVLDNVHTWNGASTGIVFDGDIPGSASAGSNRLLNSYLDFSNLILTNPHQMLVSNNFFLGGGHIVLRSSTSVATNARSIAGLTISGSQYNGPYKADSIVLDESESTFQRVSDVSIDGTQLDAGYVARSTKARIVERVTASGEGLYCFDLRATLLFPAVSIDWVQLTWRAPFDSPADARWTVSDQLPSVLPAGDVRGVCLQAWPISGWNSTVYLEVDQSPRSQIGLW